MVSAKPPAGGAMQQAVQHVCMAVTCAAALLRTASCCVVQPLRLSYRPTQSSCALSASHEASNRWCQVTHATQLHPPQPAVTAAPQPEVHEHRLNTWDPKARHSNSQLEGNQRAPGPLPTNLPRLAQPTHSHRRHTRALALLARVHRHTPPRSLASHFEAAWHISCMQRHTAPAGTQAQGRA